MRTNMYWYRVEFYESWDVENRLHVAYVLAPENAGDYCLHFFLYKQQLRGPITTDGNIQIEKVTCVEKTIVDDGQGLTNTK